MRIGFAVRPYLASLGRKARSRAILRVSRRIRRPSIESLDRRELLSAIPSPVSMLSSTTLDSKGVTFSYAVTGPDPSLTIGVYRSAVPGFDSTAVPVASPLVAPAVDNVGQPSTALGVHQLTIPLAGGLPINPKHPYVVVVADPGSASASDPGESASFRKVVIGIVTHGGLEDMAWKKDAPPWERQMAQSLRDQGYDDVIAYNWVAESSTPGEAAKQGPILAKMVLDEASKFPANDPVDIQFIGHSEGAVVNTQAIVKLEAKATPQVKAGFLEDTLLDPHAANPDFPGPQYSVARNPLGWIAKLAIDNYQSRARDPLAFIPAGVDAAQVFYQQSPANRDHNSNLGIYNLWGQVPVKGATVYFNLTSDGVVHSGKNGVYAWYEHNVVPTIGNGGQQVARETLTGALDASSLPDGHTIKAAHATYSGTSEPGSTVYLLASRPKSGHLEVVGHALTDADGTWSATTRTLAGGRHRVIAEARLPKSYKGDRPPVPTATLGLLVVQTRGTSFSRT
jgi:hypothetical protein